ncbi:hypothetical protein ACP4OV_019265 [Aristida adscensionis]
MEHDGHRLPRGADRISDLPDDVLHCILLRVGSLPAAARTSVLSRRWRRVWTGLPELVLHLHDDYGGGGGQLRSHHSFICSVDGALAGCAAPAVRVLTISMFSAGSRVPAARVAGWLRFAARRVAGELSLCLPWLPGPSTNGAELEDLELPPCATATAIQLGIGHGFRRLRLPRAGAFAALTCMRVQHASIDCRDLEKLVSLQCPLLVELELMGISLPFVSDVLIHSGTLMRLSFDVENCRRLVIDAPRIEELSLSNVAKVAVTAVATRVEEGLSDADERNSGVQLAGGVGGRHLRRLAVKGSPQVMPVLTKHFHTVDELRLDLVVPPGEGYKSFVRSTTKLASCYVLVVILRTECHRFASSVIYRLKRSTGVRKLVVYLPSEEDSTCMPGCVCRPEGSVNTYNITLDSLETVEIHYFTGADREVEFVKLLLSCKNISESRVVINLLCFVRSLGEGIS